MKKTKVIFSFVLLSLMLAACNLPGTKGSTSGDGVYTVEFFAAAGILQGHARNETEYRDLAAGSATLSSGSFLRTLDGEAFVVLPDDSVLKLGANTEVQLGLYEDGIMVWQYSGETLHIVTPREETNYLVNTPFGPVEAHGTEFEIRIDYPAAGWVAVYWGEIGIVETTPREVYGLVPEGVLFISPAGSSIYVPLEPGDTLTLDIDPATGELRRSRDATPPDAEAQRNQGIARQIRDLMQAYWDGIITREEYHNGLNDLLNQALGLAEPEGGEEYPPVLNTGSLFAGMSDSGQVVNICYDGTYVTRISWATELQCVDATTNETYTRWYTFQIGPDAILTVGNDGRFGIPEYQVDPALSVDTYITVDGTIGRGGGGITLTVQSDSDVESCASAVTIPVHPTGTSCSGQ